MEVFKTGNDRYVVIVLKIKRWNVIWKKEKKGKAVKVKVRKEGWWK